MRFKDKKEAQEKQKKAYDFLINKGIPPHLSAGIVGNLMQESFSHLDSTVENEIGAVGIAQWLGARRKDLENFAKKRGADFKDFDLQLEFLHHELTTTGNSWNRRQQEQFFNAKNAEEAAKLFVSNFERSGEKPGDKGFDNRVNFAKSIFLQFNDKNVYSKDKNGNVIVLNPKIVTERDIKKSPSIKREFYNSMFDLPNETPNLPDTKTVVEAKEDIEKTSKELEFKNKLPTILRGLNPVQKNKPQTEQEVTQRPFNFEESDISVPENEFFTFFNET